MAGKNMRVRRYKSGKNYFWRRVLVAVLALVLLAALIVGAVALIRHFSSGGDRGGASSTNTSTNTSTPPSSSAAAAGGSAAGSSSQTASAPTIDKSDWRLLLVGPNDPLPSGYVPQVVDTDYEGYQFDSRAVDAFNQMMADAAASGNRFWVVSSYRTVARSKELYEGKVQEYVDQGYSQQEAEEEAAQWIAPPGTSEHNAGLSADLVPAAYFDGVGLEQVLEDEPEYQWLWSHCADYGFILRFPKGKEDVTGIHYEPWHFRYVGVEHAREITRRGITLEEYLAQA